MQIEYIYFTIYLLLCFWFIPKITFVKNADLTANEIKILLLFKILSGFLCSFYFAKISFNEDYLGYNDAGMIQHELLLSNPLFFFTDFKSDLHQYGAGGIFESSYSFWAYLRFNLLYKFIAILNFISKGHFFINSAIFCSLVFFGHIAFYRVFSNIYSGHKYKLLFVCFFLPSLVLYTACVHKDGLIFIGLGIISFIIHAAFSNKTSSHFKRWGLFAAALFAIFLVRNYVVVALLPALLTALICYLYPLKKTTIFIATYTFYTFIFFFTGLFTNSFNLPAAVVKRKADFALLEKGNTDIPMNELLPTLKSFVLNLPQAINHSLFRPYLWEFSNPGVLLTALELLLYQLLFVAFIFFRDKKTATINTFNLFGFAFFLNMMLIIGYTIPNIGAIVRYRGIFWVFILCPIICNTDWGKLIFFKKNNPLL